MAILWAESFDYYGLSETAMTNGLWAQVSSWDLSTTRARTGTHSLSLTAPGSTAGQAVARRVFGGAKTTVGVAFASYLTDLPASNNTYGIEFRDTANNENLSIVIQSTGILTARRGATATGTTIASTDAPALVANAWNHIEIKAVAGNGTAGAVEVRVNEVTVLNLTGIDTVDTSNVEFSQVVWGELSGTQPTTIGWYLDDIFTWDTNVVGDNDVVDFVGDKKVFTCFTTADTAEADFLKSAGATGYTLIDEATPDDADYIYSATDGDVSEFEITDLPANAAEVIAVIPVPRVLKTDAGTVFFKADLVTNGDATAADEIPATTQATYWPFVFTKNPDTGVPHTPTTFNATKLRLSRVAP